MVVSCRDESSTIRLEVANINTTTVIVLVVVVVVVVVVVFLPPS